MSVFKTAALTILLCAASAYAPPGWAQQNGAPANPPAGAAPGPAVEPKAIELINAMGAKLDAAKTMSFWSGPPSRSRRETASRCSTWFRPPSPWSARTK